MSGFWVCPSGSRRPGNTGNATFDTCCLNARVPWTREAHWRSSFSGMTSLGRGQDLITQLQLRCCLPRSLLILPLLLLIRLILSNSSLALVMHWDVPPPWSMELQCLAVVEAFLLDVSSAACTWLPLSASVVASLHLPAWLSVH